MHIMFALKLSSAAELKSNFTTQDYVCTNCLKNGEQFCTMLVNHALTDNMNYFPLPNILLYVQFIRPTNALPLFETLEIPT